MVFDLLLAILVTVGILLIIAAPWLLLWECWRERHRPQADDMSWLGIPICVVMCLAEVAMVIDWLIDKPSKLM